MLQQLCASHFSGTHIEAETRLAYDHTDPWAISLRFRRTRSDDSTVTWCIERGLLITALARPYEWVGEGDISLRRRTDERNENECLDIRLGADHHRQAHLWIRISDITQFVADMIAEVPLGKEHQITPDTAYTLSGFQPGPPSP
jgi:hypothetical protein